LRKQRGALDPVLRLRLRHVQCGDAQVPIVRQPYLDQSLVIEATRKAGLAVTAYCAMAVGRVLTDPTIAEIADSHARTIPQIVLR